MKPNAYILNWTMNGYGRLLNELKEFGFGFQKEIDEGHVMVDVPFSRIDEFAKLVQTHLNAPYNYVDIQYPNKKKTVVIFQKRKFSIETEDQNEEAKKWAISIGLPPKQADWGKSF